MAKTTTCTEILHNIVTESWDRARTLPGDAIKTARVTDTINMKLLKNCFGPSAALSHIA